MTYPRLIQPIYAALPNLLKHPFHVGLQNGTLDQRVFDHFLRQDILYLRAYSRVLKQISHRIELDRDKKLFIELSEYIAQTEIKSHKHFLNSHRFFPNPRISTLKESEAASDYIKFLQRSVQHHPVEISIASVLPCFVIYKELGRLLTAEEISRNNPYHFWLRTYASQRFVNFTDDLTSTTHMLAEKCDNKSHEEMIKAIEQSIHLETSLWDEAVKQSTSSMSHSKILH